MIFTQTPLAGAWTVDPEHHADDRGSFARTFCAREFEMRGMNPRVAQSNVSVNKGRGVLRGMHFQRAPHGETKLVRVTRGSVFDVIVDLRADSASYKKWFGVELSAESGRALYVPLGFAHGFQTLSDDAEVLYLMGDFHAPGSGVGVRYDDPVFAIDWPAPPSIISPADLAFPPFGI